MDHKAGFAVSIAMVDAQDVRAFAGDFVGTFMLVTTVGFNVLNPSALGVSIACTVVVMIYAFAHVSGAHLNPGVTLSLAIRTICCAVGCRPLKREGGCGSRTCVAIQRDCLHP